MGAEQKKIQAPDDVAEAFVTLSDPYENLPKAVRESILKYTPQGMNYSWLVEKYFRFFSSMGVFAADSESMPTDRGRNLVERLKEKDAGVGVGDPLEETRERISQELSNAPDKLHSKITRYISLGMPAEMIDGLLVCQGYTHDEVNEAMHDVSIRMPQELHPVGNERGYSVSEHQTFVGFLQEFVEDLRKHEVSTDTAREVCEELFGAVSARILEFTLKVTDSTQPMSQVDSETSSE